MCEAREKECQLIVAERRMNQRRRASETTLIISDAYEIFVPFDSCHYLFKFIYPSRDVCVLTSVFVTRADFHVSTHFIGLFKTPTQSVSQPMSLPVSTNIIIVDVCVFLLSETHEYKLSLHTKGVIIKV